MGGLLDLLFGDEPLGRPATTVSQMDSIQDLVSLTEARIGLQPSMTAAENFGVALGLAPVTAAQAPAGLSGLGKVLYDAQRFLGIQLPGGVMVGTNSLVATPGVTSALDQQLTALKAVDAAVKSGNLVLAQELVEGLWDQGVPPDMVDKAREIVGLDPLCFPASAPIAISLTQTRPISDIRIGDTVLAFDPAADLGRGALVPRKVVRLYRNTTDEWIKLTWAEGGEAKELIATPGHHFLDRFGSFPTIEEMLENGRATVVLASGELTEVTAERITYSAQTAHLFEQAQAVGMIAGNAALKPAAIDAWQSYNFEVEDLHTYVAGGVRVHNSSGFLGRIGNSIDDALDRMLGGSDQDGSARDQITDILTSPLHAAGELVSGLVRAAGFVAGGIASALGALSRGDLGGAIGGLAAGLGGAASSLLGGIAQAANSVLSSIFGPGGNSNDDGPRTAWTDTDGRSHWGSESEYQRAVERGTVKHRGNSSDDGVNTGSGGSVGGGGGLGGASRANQRQPINR